LTANAEAAPGAARPALGAKGVFAAVLGNGFEFFDFTVYATFLGMIGQAFFPSDNPLISDLASAATFGVGFIARPLGGALIGAYGDRAGRKPAMTLSIGLMAIGSALIALTPGYATIGVWAPILLVAARLCQGFAVGGEVGPSTMFMLEAAPPDRRMFFASWQLASQNLGSLVSGVIGVLLALTLSKSSLNDWGWRVPFSLGILIAPVGIYIRSQLVETLDHSQHEVPNNTGAILSTVIKSNWPGLLLGLAFIAGGTITQYFLITMTPYAIRTFICPTRRPCSARLRLPRRARGGNARRSLGHPRSYDRPAHLADDRSVSGDEVPDRQSERGDAGPGDHDPQPAASRQQRRRGDADPPGLSASRPFDRARNDLFAWGRDLRRHRDLCGHVAGRRHRRSAGLDLLCDGGQCRIGARCARRPQYRI
jgi:MFS family permease